MFENFPYTNLHDLNLDWIIQKVKEAYSPDNPPENVVLSVNGQTGEVILYQDPDIEFPEVDSNIWRMVRTANGTTMGVAFQYGKMFVMNGNQASKVYSEADQPPYPVTSVDGQTGAVEVFPNAATRLKDVNESYTNIRRQIKTDDTNNIVGIELTQNKAYRMKDQYRYEIYDSNNTPPYPVTSVNGSTGNVVLAIPFEGPLTNSIWQAETASADHHAGIARDTVDGNVIIYAETTATGASAYLSFLSTDEQYNVTQKLLTTDDIPSSSGVVSINGMNGVVTLYGTDISRSSSDSTNIDAALTAIEGDITNIENTIAYVESTSTASRNYSTGDYFTVAGILRKATASITSGDTIDNTNSSVVSGGLGAEIDNALDQITAIENTVAYVEYTSTASRNYSTGDYFTVAGILRKATASISSGATIDNTNSSVVSGGLGEEITELSDHIAMQQILSGTSGTAIPWTLSTIKDTYKELCVRALKRTDSYNYNYYLVINIPTVMLDSKQVYEVSDASDVMTIEILSGSIKVSVTYNGSAVANEVKVYAR